PHVGWKNLHVVSAVGGGTIWTPLRFFGVADRRYSLRFGPTTAKGWQLGLLLPRALPAGFEPRGMVRAELTEKQRESLKQSIGDEMERFDTTLYRVRRPGRGAAIDRAV